MNTAIKSVFFCLTLILYASRSYAQVNFHKIEKYYDLGKYEKALKFIEKAKDKQANISDLQRTILYAHKSKLYEALRDYESMEQQIKLAKSLLQVYEVRSKKDRQQYNQSVLLISDAYLSYQNYLKADLILNFFQQKDNDSISTISFLRRKAEISLGYKNFETSTRYIDTILTAETFFSLKKHQLNHTQAFLDFLKALTLKGRLLSSRGYYDQAGTFLQNHRKYIRAKAGVRSNIYLDHLLAIGENYDQQLNYYQARWYYNRVLNANKLYDFTYRKSSKFYTDLQEKVARNTINDKKGIIRQENEIKRLKNVAKKKAQEGNPFTLLNTFLLDAEKHIAKKEFQEAEVLLNHIIYNNSLPDDHILRGRALALLYQLYTLNDKNIEGAEQHILEWSEVQKKRLDTTSVAYQIIQLQLAAFYTQFTDDFKRSREIIAQIPYSSIIENFGSSSPWFMDLSNYYASYYLRIGDYQKAHDLLKKIEPLIHQRYGSLSAQAIEQYQKVAETQIYLSNFSEAEFSIKQAIETARKLYSRRSLEYAGVISKSAKLQSIIGNYDQAEKILREVDKILRRKQIENISLRSDITSELAKLYIRTGAYSKTERILEDNLQYLSKKYGGNSRKMIDPYHDLALLYITKGDYEKAEKFIDQAASMIENIYGKNTILYSDNLLLRALFYKEIGSYKKAVSQIDEAINIRKQFLGEAHFMLAKAYTEKALIELESDVASLENTEQTFTKAQDIVLKAFGNKHPQYAIALNHTAHYYIYAERWPEAIEILLQTEQIWKEKIGVENDKIAGVYFLLGRCYQKQKAYSQAEKYYTQARALYQKIFGTDHPDYVKTQSKLAQIAYISENYDLATQYLNFSTSSYLSFIQKYFPSLSEKEKATYWDAIKEDFEFYKSLAVKQSSKDPELIAQVYHQNLATKALLLNTSIKIRSKILQSANDTLISKYKEWITQKEYLSSVMTLSQEELMENSLSADSLESSVEKLEKYLSEASDLFHKNKDIHWQEIRDALAKNEVVIDITRFRLFEDDFTDSILYLAMKITPDTKNYPEFIVMPYGKLLENEMLSYYRNAMNFNISNKKCYPWYWQPIEKLAGDAKKIYLSLDGVFHQVNLSSIQVSDSSYVLDQSEIVLISNSKDLIFRNKDKKTNNTAALFGDPVFYASSHHKTNISQLPGTAHEIDEVKVLLSDEQWRVNQFTQDQANEDAVKTLESPRVFHVATHGFFIENVGNSSQNVLLKSGLLLSGAGDLLSENTAINYKSGILTAYEAMNLNLDQTELVVLSACDTGKGEIQIGEGVYGLQRAFLVAGADAVIMSLFKVSDDVTRELMTQFYKNWLISGSKHKAFRQAQIKIKEKYQYPIYWGAFIMIGVD